MLFEKNNSILTSYGWMGLRFCFVLSSQQSRCQNQAPNFHLPWSFLSNTTRCPRMLSFNTIILQQRLKLLFIYYFLNGWKDLSSSGSPFYQLQNLIKLLCFSGLQCLICKMIRKLDSSLRSLQTPRLWFYAVLFTIELVTFNVWEGLIRHLPIRVW